MATTSTPKSSTDKRKMDSPLMNILKKSKVDIEVEPEQFSNTEAAISNLSPDTPLTVGSFTVILIAHAKDIENQFACELAERDATIEELKTKIEKLEGTVDHMEQYTRRNSVRISGIAEEEDVSSNEQTISLLEKELKLEIKPWDILGTHRVGRKTPGVSRPILVKFSTHHKKQKL